MLDQKGTEPLAAEFDRLVREYREPYPESTQQEAWNLIADFAIENADTISRALSAITPAEVGGLVDAPVGFMRPKDIQRLAEMHSGATTVQIANLSFGGWTEPVYAATALTAKDAELAAAEHMLELSKATTEAVLERAERAEAQLAEARKALEQRDTDITEFMGRLGSRWFLEQGWFPASVGAREDDARRALTGGKNG